MRAPASAYFFYSALALILAVLGLLLYWVIQADAIHWLAQANRWLANNFIERLGYFGVFALMFIESSFVPFPSEIIMPPAGDLARRLPSWSLGWVIAMGVLGSLGGALFNYALARYLGRPALVGLIRRYGRYFHFSLKSYDSAEAYFARHGEFSTFTGRLLPGIRQIISLPAGLARMNLASFCLFTSLGAGIWVVVLALLGYWFGSQPEQLAAAMKQNTLWLIGATLLLVGGYVLLRRFRNTRKGEG
ncbi:MAG: DedA family protein [SAR324 cluster bacterium]|nr:DedA family protein [SAR324 cluster bacterium]